MSEQAHSPSAADAVDENQVIAARRAKLDKLRAGGNAYPNTFRRDTVAAELHGRFGESDATALEAVGERFAVGGRLMLKRVMGKASFGTLQDSSGRIQIFCQLNTLGEAAYEVFKSADIGDILGVKGKIFRTKTGELSLWVESLELLTKNLRPLPEKWAGLTDTETRYRQRYLDLVVNPEVKLVFEKRVAAVRFIRHYLDNLGYMEVETPMLHVIPGGATARPFVTHHNALDRELFLRIAPELYLKRLVVGHFEKVYEINRNFRNEGLSTRHNPEFTMLEFYQAYADYRDLMDLTEDLIRNCAINVNGSAQLSYQGRDYDLEKPFSRLSMTEAVRKYCCDIPMGESLPLSKCEPLPHRVLDEKDVGYLAQFLNLAGAQGPWGKLLTEAFERFVEPYLLDPTFITEYPTEVSPLARRSDHNPDVTDRFEFFLGGREVANGFSELNDADDQAARFHAQVEAKHAGDDEAMFFDADYIRALEIGLPPTAGEGIGIDRLVMFLTDSASIRDVLLFPAMRPEAK